MEPITLGILGGMAAAGVVSSIIANGQKASAEERARAIQEKQAQEWLKISIPDAAQRKIALDRYVKTGTFTPELEESILKEQSNFEKIKTDPAYKQIQMKALDKLSELGEESLTLTDKAALQDVQNQAAVNAKSRNAQITDEMARRGTLNSGFELAAKLGANQQAGDVESRAGLDIAAKARQRALDSIMAGGQLGGQLRSQEYGEQKDLASARDAIADFNARNRQNVQQRNVERQNQAQQQNLALEQELANKNVDLANKQNIYNKETDRQYMNDVMQRQAGATGQFNKMADTEIKQGQTSADLVSGIGQSVIGGLGAYGANQAGRVKTPEEIQEEELRKRAKANPAQGESDYA